jgi:pimeloyl-ACP methyl ester carboxylesterase
MTYEPHPHRALARDGTSIAWHTYTTSREGTALRKDRAPVLLTNGLGTTPNFWKPLVAGLVPEQDVVHWDYRGHGASESSRAHDYAMTTQADDLRVVTEAMRDAWGVLPAVHVAFSMGVTVLLELYRSRPDLVRAMVLVAGGADHPYAASPLFRVPGTRAAVRAGLRAVAPLVPRLVPAARRVLESRALYPLGRAAGALAKEAPREEIDHFFKAIGSMDPTAYWGTLRALLEASATDVLPKLRVPVLVIAPAHDLLAPARDLAKLRTLIPGVRVVDVPGTGHAILLEAGEAVAGHIRRFLHELSAAPGKGR